MRVVARLATLAAIAPLASCGVCLLVQHQQVELRMPDGERIAVDVAYRTEDGILNLESPVRRLLFGLLLEPLDWVLSTAGAVNAVFSSDTDVVLGPVGWLCTLTPFATLFPAPAGPLQSKLEIDAEHLRRLRAGDLDAAREVFHDARIRDVTFR